LILVLIKKLGNGVNILFWHDRWITDCALKSHFPLLYQLASNKQISVAEVIRFNRFYLSFSRSLSEVLRQQVLSLYNLLSMVNLNTINDIYIWRWSNFGIFSVNSCYSWMDFGGVKDFIFHSIWSSYIPLKIIFLWLV
jgi:hypothetical protein